jgi:glycosyltransferase involved in cell wall biosynthesis
MNSLTVIIPTYNRCETLHKALSGYLAQTALDEIAEILVVDDGSTDSTADVVARFAKAASVPVRYLRQENRGPAAARNVGIREAKSELVLFTDDDIVPGATLVSEHLDWHRRFPDTSNAVLGQVTWSPEVNPTPFMRWYGSDGALFAYAHLENQTHIDCRYFYTCNISLKVELLRSHGIFDEDFKVAAWEDAELGYRLQKAGMQLLYNSGALAYHHQHVSFDDACRRATKVAAAAEVFKKKEAWIHVHSSPQPRSRLFLRRCLVAGSSGKAARALLSPLKRFMDSSMEFPRNFYKLMLLVFDRA